VLYAMLSRPIYDLWPVGRHYCIFAHVRDPPPALASAAFYV